MATIKTTVNIRRDIWNWWQACKTQSHGVDWKMKIPAQLRRRIAGKTEGEAEKFLAPYLKKLYRSECVSERLPEIQRGFKKIQKRLFARMTKVTGRPIYRRRFTCFLTTFPRCPYDFDHGYVWLIARKSFDDQVATFIHELLHFQYFAYYGERVWNELGRDKHTRLKEAMTVILNDEFCDLSSVPDRGYEIDASLRPKLLALWRKDRNMDRFIDRAIRLMKK